MGCGSSKPRVNDGEVYGTVPIYPTPSGGGGGVKTADRPAFDRVAPHASSSSSAASGWGPASQSQQQLDRQGSASYQMWQSIGDLVLDDAAASAANPSTRVIIGESGGDDESYDDESYDDGRSFDDEDEDEDGNTRLMSVVGRGGG